MFKHFKENLFVKTFGLTKVPLLGWVRPKIIELSSERIVVRIRLTRRTKNHLNSMYFGTMAIGADTAVGALALHKIWHQGNQLSLVFKDFKADFLKRAEDDVHFICEAGAQLQSLVDRAMHSGEREQESIAAHATVPRISGDEAVARFVLTLSLKRKLSK